MARYVTTIESHLSVLEAFAYMASFEHALEWDPSVVGAERLDEGELRVGSAFRILSRFAGRTVPLRYEVTALQPGRRVVLEARNKRFASIDTITVATSATGCTVTYDARLVICGAARLADPLFQLAFVRVGRRADASLRVHLNPR